MGLLLAAICTSKFALQLDHSILHPGLCAPTCQSALNVLLMTIAQMLICRGSGKFTLATLSRGGEKVQQLHSLSALCCLAGGKDVGQALLSAGSPPAYPRCRCYCPWRSWCRRMVLESPDCRCSSDASCCCLQEYFLACACEEIYMPPTANVYLTGFSVAGALRSFRS